MIIGVDGCQTSVSTMISENFIMQQGLLVMKLRGPVVLFVKLCRRLCLSELTVMVAIREVNNQSDYQPYRKVDPVPNP